MRGGTEESGIWSIRLIANVNHVRPRSSLPQPQRKQHELVSIAKPFAKATISDQAAKERRRAYNAHGMARSVELHFKQIAETQHAVLSVERVILNQQYFQRCAAHTSCRYLTATARRFWLNIALPAVSPVSTASHNRSIMRIAIHRSERIKLFNP